MDACGPVDSSRHIDAAGWRLGSGPIWLSPDRLLFSIFSEEAGIPGRRPVGSHHSWSSCSLDSAQLAHLSCLSTLDHSARHRSRRIRALWSGPVGEELDRGLCFCGRRGLAH